jgi:Ca-activated chloride channel family protein
MKSRSFLLLNRYLQTAALLAVVFAFASPGFAQDPDEVIRTSTSLVQLNIGVVDQQGRAITSLKQSDFSVYEDGVKQEIQLFQPAQDPFSLVLLLDMSGSTINFRQQLKLATQRFLDALSPEDRVAVVQFDSKVKMLANFGTDRKKSAYAIDIANGRGDTYLFDAMKYALKMLDREGKRRKAIVVLTDGVDTQLRNNDRRTAGDATTNDAAIASIKPDAHPELRALLESADRVGVTIFPLALPTGDPQKLPLVTPNMIAQYASARARLRLLADRTGGRLNEITKLQYMAELYREVAASLRTLYTVAYQAKGDRTRGKWHEIRVEVPYAELTARTKTGYYAR